jgi:hypothetical protein
MSINASGAIVGYYGDANHLFHAFVRNAQGRFISFDAPGALQQQFVIATFPVEIEDDGTVLGEGGPAGTNRGFLRSRDGVWTIFDPPGNLDGDLFVSYATSLAINPAGVITGTYDDTSGGNFNLRGFIRNRDGTFTVFDGADYPPCCAWTFPFAITPGGVIVGSINDGNGINRGFVRARDGSTTIFDAPNAGGQGQGTFPTAVTPDGKMIMGLDVDASDVSHGFIRLTR